MIKLNLTLGNTFFEHFYLPFSIMEYGDIFLKINQHKINLSEKIINYYNECADKNGYRDVCCSYLQDLVTSSKKCNIVRDYGENDIVNELIEVAKEQKMKLLLAEKGEIGKVKSSGIKLYDAECIKKNDKCLLNLYSMPITSRYVPAKDKIDGYKTWISNWVKGEEKVIIRDKYLLKEDDKKGIPGLLAFKQHFLPMFNAGTVFEIHTDYDVDKAILDIFDDAEYTDYSFYVYKCEKMHDRVLIFDGFQIVIGKGIQFMSGDWDRTAESFISISKITIDADSTKIKQLR